MLSAIIKMPISKCSEVAQWWSRRLLTARSRVRAPPSEPFFNGIYAGVAELADAQDLKSCDPYRSYRFDPGLRHQFYFLAAADKNNFEKIPYNINDDAG